MIKVRLAERKNYTKDNKKSHTKTDIQQKAATLKRFSVFQADTIPTIKAITPDTGLFVE